MYEVLPQPIVWCDAYLRCCCRAAGVNQFAGTRLFCMSNTRRVYFTVDIFLLLFFFTVSPFPPPLSPHSLFLFYSLTRPFYQTCFYVIYFRRIGLNDRFLSTIIASNIIEKTHDRNGLQKQSSRRRITSKKGIYVRYKYFILLTI